MSTDQQSVEEQSSDTETDEEPDIRAQHERAQASGEVFQGRPHGER